MVYKDDYILVQNRIKTDWPGITFPGGKVENEELIIESAKRELKEETGLTALSLEQVGYYEWNTIEENVRHLAILFRTDSYTGDIKSSSEGEIFFLKRNEINKYQLSNDFLDILKTIDSYKK